MSRRFSSIVGSLPAFAISDTSILLHISGSVPRRTPSRIALAYTLVASMPAHLSKIPFHPSAPAAWFVAFMRLAAAHIAPSLSILSIQSLSRSAVAGPPPSLSPSSRNLMHACMLYGLRLAKASPCFFTACRTLPGSNISSYFPLSVCLRTDVMLRPSSFPALDCAFDPTAPGACAAISAVVVVSTLPCRIAARILSA